MEITCHGSEPNRTPASVRDLLLVEPVNTGQGSLSQERICSTSNHETGEYDCPGSLSSQTGSLFLIPPGTGRLEVWLSDCARRSKPIAGCGSAGAERLQCIPQPIPGS